MRAMTRRMALTPDLVARIHRDVPDAGSQIHLSATTTPMTEADYDAVADGLLAGHAAHRAAGADGFWVFAYGSLIWRPACDTEAQAHAHLRGWHRRFCMRITRWRGTQDCPGLMMALERGGSCHGVIQRLPDRDLAAALAALVRRETSVKPMTNQPRWVSTLVDGRRVPALAFTANRRGAFYAGRLDLDATADVLASACGHWGTCAEYLLNTVVHLEALGIHDRYLWRLQEMVAERIAAQDAAGLPSPVR
jgi:cation transport protein ChaC